MSKIPILTQHRHEKPFIGLIEASAIEGLYLKFNPPICDKDFWNIFPTAGARIIDAEYNTETNIFLYKEVRIIEFSL